MDATKFDIVAKVAGSATRRRHLPRVILGAAAGLLAAAETAAAKGGACALPCDECSACEPGRCKKKRGRKKCNAGKCRVAANGTGCDGGECRDGVCNAEPICTSFNFMCTKPSECCSNNCNLNLLQCRKGEAGAACHSGSDCTSGSCAGFRCD